MAGDRLARRALSAIAGGALPVLLLSYSGGPPARRTAAPGDRSCMDSSCHSGERFDDSSAIRFDAGPAGLVYTPGGPRQRWIFRNADKQARAYGFQVSVRAASDPARLPAGDLSPANAVTSVICEDERFKGASGCESSAPLQFLQHIEPNPDGVLALDWTPPAADAGDVIVYVASNASVAGQRNSRIHHRSFRMTASTEPRLSMSQVSPGSALTIFGSGLAAASRSVRPEDWNEAALPTRIDSTEVRINGKPAFLTHVSPGHVIAVAPEDDTEGSVAVEVIRDGAVVLSLPATAGRFSPAWFAPLPEAPVRAGDTVSFEATGLGPADPPVPVGATAANPAPCAFPVLVRVGGAEASVLSAVLASPGIYRITFIVPQLSPGEHVVEAEVEGWRSSSNFHLRVIR